ncbi:IPT/TIG domain-containing protein [Flavobacterium wongokense]|uniref:IPT/TIG domain-containing protein n=1 Tax=Flavobacterium wongokense TaxID=2910674 RepID=UPI001F4240E0|nr:IPT/TIG domain-containing protein [Flavobacterium sp. WG47]MCF6133169.1 IPT/TIG domain-containing protein [Flavobacterium sp. WG47]
MKQFLRIIRLVFLFGILMLQSCSTDDGMATTVVTYPETGLLGKEVTIELNYVHFGDLQVFFDLEEAQVTYVSHTEIKAVIPRTITNHTPRLKIIDLVTNETILDETISLKTPVINGYSQNQVSYNTVFSIYGENFDELSNDVKVYANNQPAQIISTNYNEIQVMLPTNITSSNIQIKVNAQRQDVVSTIGLQLRNPVISAVASPTAWIRGQLVVTGDNFNPNYEYGEVWVNGVQCYFSASTNQLSIDMPPGPFSDFQVTNITYKTAGLTANFNTNVPIGNDAIMVDHSAAAFNKIFVHNNKAYALTTFSSSPFGGNADYVLMEFSPVTEKWTQLSSFSYNGRIDDAVYDGSNSLYIYKASSTGTFALTKLDMNSFAQSSITLPDNKIRWPILFAYDSHLYLLSGLDDHNGTVVTSRTEKYSYSEATNSWTLLSSSAFPGMPLVDPQGSGSCQYLHHGNNIYLSYGINFKTYKITPSLGVTEYNYSLMCGYQNAVIGRYGNLTSPYLYNIATNASMNPQQDLIGWSGSFFTINNQVYYIKNSWTEYYQNTYYTQKLRSSILNGLL